MLLLFAGLSVDAQLLPRQQWIKRYGGTATDVPFAIRFTADGGTITAGYTESKNGDVTASASTEYWDLWLIKLDKCGNIQWQKTLGGTGYESARDVAQTADGGFIVLGETNSTDGDVVKGYGGTKDIWLIKTDGAGAVQWQKRFGGSGLDIGNRIVTDEAGNYIIAGTTASNDGDVKGNHGTGGFTDGWLLKVAASGNLLWSKCFGGSKNEELMDVVLHNGRTYVAGYANSIDGDIPPTQKNYDVWLLALDAAGGKVFSKVYGGTQNDVAYSMALGADGSLALAGYTTSDDGDVTGAKGSQDYWVLNVSTAGKLQWQQTLGGTEADYANSIVATANGYTIGGITYSVNGNVQAGQGGGDYWLVQLGTTGALQGQRLWGGRGNDHLRSLIYHTQRNEWYIAGNADSRNGDFSFSRPYGETDFGIIKLKEPVAQLKDSVVCAVAGFVPYKDTLPDGCGFDSVVVTYVPKSLKQPLTNKKNRDSIFIGQSITLPSFTDGRTVWNAHPALSCGDCASAVAKPGVTTTFTATTTLPDGCVSTGNFTVVVLNDAVVLTPSAFTPNGDGRNDFFGPLGKVPDDFRIEIFNRWGQVVFRSTTMNARWDGRYSGALQPQGAYPFIIYYKDINNTAHQQKGVCTLIR